MRAWLDRFMSGRNGVDFLNKRLIFLAVLLWGIGLLLGRIGLLPVLLAGYALFRALSRNTAARQREDLAARAFSDALSAKLSGAWTRLCQSRDYRFYTCPGCGSRLRVPRGKGSIQITCPRCGHRFGGRS